MLMGFGRFALQALSAPNLDPANRWKAPAVVEGIEARSGPIEIAIEYTIREKDVPRFLALMAERRRIRRRDGARRWSLVRGIENAELWIESYRFPTWLDYVRHNHRGTLADVHVGDGLRALHAGREPPRVRRLIERQVKGDPDDHPSGMASQMH